MTTQVNGFARPGSVVEFLHGNEAHIAWVLEDQGGRLALLTLTKRDVKLPAGRLLPWTGPDYPPQASRQEILDRLQAHEKRRRELKEAIDVMGLWSLAQGEMERAGLHWLAGLVWDRPDPDQLAALGRALLEAKTHFRFNPPEFEIHTAEKVELRLAQLEEARQREQLVDGGLLLFRALWEGVRNGREPRPPALEAETGDRLKALLLDVMARTSDEKTLRLWESVTKGLPDNPHLALLLAQAWGVAPAHHNHLLNEAGFAWDDNWSEAFAGDVADVAATFAQAATLPENAPEPAAYVSIDAPTTLDIDDAFLIAPGEGGGVRLSIALARPTAAWAFGTALDKAVLHRASSLYLPEGSSHMMPEALGLKLFSLMQGKARPALVVDFDLNERAETLSVVPRLAWIKVAANISYDAAEAAIESCDDAGLCLAHATAEKLLALRLGRGASVIQRPDPDIRLEGEGRDTRVLIGVKPPHPKADLVVSEFMILVNAGLAAWGSAQGVPLLHRTQNIALPPEACGVFSEPAALHAAVKLLTPTSLEVTPRRHAALGVDAYSPVSSPIRRYVDLINMGQASSFLASGRPRLDADALSTLLPGLTARIHAVTQVQRYRPRYWKLVHLSQVGREPQPAVLVEDSGAYPALTLPHLQINVRAPRRLLGDKLYPGQRFSLTFGRIDPLGNEIKIIEAIED